MLARRSREWLGPSLHRSQVRVRRVLIVFCDLGKPVQSRLMSAQSPAPRAHWIGDVEEWFVVQRSMRFVGFISGLQCSGLPLIARRIQYLDFPVLLATKS